MEKKVDFGDQPPNRQLGNYILTRLKIRKCKVCRGLGHFSYECTTKKRLDKHAKMMDMTCEWGAIKSTVMAANYDKFKELYHAKMKERHVGLVRSIGYTE